MAKLHRFFGIEAAENLFAAVGIHRGEIAHEFLARLVLCVFAPANPDRDETGDAPDDDVSRGQLLTCGLLLRVARCRKSPSRAQLADACAVEFCSRPAFSVER